MSGMIGDIKCLLLPTTTLHLLISAQHEAHFHLLCLYSTAADGVAVVVVVVVVNWSRRTITAGLQRRVLQHLHQARTFFLLRH